MGDQPVACQFSAHLVADVVVAPVRLLVDDATLVVQEWMHQDEGGNRAGVGRGDEGADAPAEACAQEWTGLGPKQRQESTEKDRADQGRSRPPPGAQTGDRGSCLLRQRQSAGKADGDRDAADGDLNSAGPWQIA